MMPASALFIQIWLAFLPVSKARTNTFDIF